jgi:hypothetical protein
MTILSPFGVINSGLFRSELYKSSISLVGNHQAVPSLRLDENHRLSLEECQLKEPMSDRIVGIVKKSLLESCKIRGDVYVVDHLMSDLFNLGDDLNKLYHLDESYSAQPVLPIGSDLAVSQDVVVTAGHVADISPELLCVVQF